MNDELALAMVISALVLTGDVNPPEVMKMAQEFYGDWAKREKDPFVEFPLVEHPPLPKSEGAVIAQPVANVIIAAKHGEIEKILDELFETRGDKSFRDTIEKLAHALRARL